MKKILYVFLVLISVLAASCNNSDKDLLSAVPESSDMVYMVDTKALIEKSGSKVKDGKVLLSPALQNLMAATLSGNNLATVREALDNYKEYGVDIEGGAVLFRNKRNYGLLVNIDSESNFVKCVEKIYGDDKVEWVESNGYKYYYLEGNESAVAVGKGRALLFGGSTLGFMKNMKSTLATEKSTSILSNAQAANFLNRKNDISLRINNNGGSLTSVFDDYYISMLGGAIDAIGSVNVSINFDKNKIILQATVDKDNAKATAINEMFKAVTVSPSNDFLKFIPSECSVVGVANLNLKSLIDMLSTNGVMDKTTFELIMHGMNISYTDFERFMKSVSGSVAFGVIPNSMNPQNMGYAAVLKSNDTEFAVDLLKRFCIAASYDVIDKGDEFVLSLYSDENFLVGARDGYVVITSLPSITDNNNHSDTMKSFFKENVIGIYTDVTSGGAASALFKNTMNSNLEGYGMLGIPSSNEANSEFIFINGGNRNALEIILEQFAQIAK